MIKSAVIFCSTNVTLGLRSLVAPNHVFCLYQLNDGVMLINPRVSHIEHNVRKVNLDQISKSRDFSIENFALTNENFLASPSRTRFFPQNTFYNLYEQNINKDNFTHKETQEEAALDYYFYKVLKTIEKKINPIAIYEIDIFKKAKEDHQRYGLPMYCHNVVINSLDLEIGNILTCLDFKVKLKHLSARSNFATYNLFERELNSEEIKLGRII